MPSLSRSIAAAAAAVALAGLLSSGPARAAAPIAAAGQDVYADAGPLIVLNGSASSDGDGDALTFAWTQIGGPAVTLVDEQTPYPSFTGDQPGAYTFSLVVSDATATSSPDTVDVHLFPDLQHDIGGCGGGGPEQASRGLGGPALAALALFRVRRRASPSPRGQGIGGG